MKLWKFNRTDVVITLKKGVIVRGFVEDFCDASDNAEEMDSLLVDVDGTLREYFEDEILSISATQTWNSLSTFINLTIRTIENQWQRKENR